MTRTPDENDAVAALRRSLGPSPRDQARVLEKTQRNASAGAYPSLDVPPPAASVGRNVAAALFGRSLPWLVGAAAVVGGSAVSYELGFSAGQKSAPVPATSPRTPDSATAVALAPPTAPAVPLALAPTTAPAPKNALGNVPPPESSVADVPAAQSLAEELRAIRRIQSALRARNPRLAQSLLAELDRAVPHGKLSEERAAAAAIAACQIEPAAARLRYFGARYPTSLHLARVKKECSPEALPNTTGDAESSNGL